MFRKPRESSLKSSEQAKSSTGRPPTPPNANNGFKSSPSTMPPRTPAPKPLTPRPNAKSNMPANERQGAKKTFNSKPAGKPNGSILNFFKKVESPAVDDGALFIKDRNYVSPEKKIVSRPPTPEYLKGLYDDEMEGVETARFNESGFSVKKRKTSNGSGDGEGKSQHSSNSSHNAVGENMKELFGGDVEAATCAVVSEACTPPPPESAAPVKRPRQFGAFIDSDSEEEGNGKLPLRNRSSLQVPIVKVKDVRNEPPTADQLRDVNEDLATKVPEQDQTVQDDLETLENGNPAPLSNNKLPPFKKERTDDEDLYGAFDDIEEFPEFPDEYADGEEFLERKWAEEQESIDERESIKRKGNNFLMNDFEDIPDVLLEDTITEACPICNANIGGITPDEATRHVNACLDGNPIPLPSPVKAETPELKPIFHGSSRFSKAAVARPPQANPFSLENTKVTSTSAFSKIMSSHAEDTAWAEAAAAETAARGKAAYQRTCPFYKIMPGFFICVDAFRYGAVQGCNAYFLSHFHSDHYIGLTSKWCHGPIYCSKITANLVKQQLRVDPQYVIALDFDSKFEIPGTQGVLVTMIPANHCPGSSLFLYDKVIGKGPSPRVQRVLHCGDFRACPEHVEHPQLIPDIIDTVTGKTKQQKIDVCYLDTTYLNPKYSFPSQKDVITACAEMCISLSKDKPSPTDAWEKVKREGAGSGMAKFINNDGPGTSPDIDAITESNANKSRGRLLVVCGTYSIGKERICLGIARALNCKIWAPLGKRRICAALEDSELMDRLTDDPKEAQIHMQMIMEIRAETLQEYLNSYKPHFSRIVGFRPSGWNYRPPSGRFVESPSVPTILGDGWRSRFSMAELVPQRGSTREASCFGVPYSEHSSFRELTMFCCALRIEKVVPTVNVGSKASRDKMKAWCDRWLAERRRNGVVRFGEGKGMVRW